MYVCCIILRGTRYCVLCFIIIGLYYYYISGAVVIYRQWGLWYTDHPARFAVCTVFVYYLHFATRTRSAKRALGLGPIVMQPWPHGYSMAILKPKRNCQVPISHEFLHGKYVVAATLLLRALVLYCTDRGPSELPRAAGVV